MYSICASFSKQLPKAQKKENAIYVNKVLHRLRHIDVGKRSNLLGYAKPILGKIHIT